MNKSSNEAETFWNAAWGDDASKDFWTKISPDVQELVESQSPDQRPQVLDLGCGLGRNAIAFAKEGFQVTASDLSPAGVAHLQEWAEKAGVEITTRVCAFDKDAFPPESFDIVVGINVIYHGNRERAARAINNVRRWLKLGGIFYFTMVSREDGEYGKGKELAPHTFELDPGHIHYHADEADLNEMLSGFKIISRSRHEHTYEKQGAPLFSSRWQVLVEKTS